MFFCASGYMTSGNLFRTLLEIAGPSGYFFIFSAVDTMIITFFWAKYRPPRMTGWTQIKWDGSKYPNCCRTDYWHNKVILWHHWRTVLTRQLGYFEPSHFICVQPVMRGGRYFAQKNVIIIVSTAEKMKKYPEGLAISNNVLNRFPLVIYPGTPKTFSKHTLKTITLIDIWHTYIYL